MAHGITAVRLETEAFRDLPRQEIPGHVLPACSNSHIPGLKRRQPICVDVSQDAGCGPKLQKRNIFALCNCTRKLWLYFNDVGISEPANQVDVVHGKIDDNAPIRHPRPKRSNASNGDRKDILAPDRVFDRFHRRIEALDMTHHQSDAGTACGPDDLAPLLDRRRDRLFHQDGDAARNTVECKIAMEMGRRCDRDRIEVALDQFANIGNSGTAQCAGNEFRLFPIRVSDPNEFGARQSGKHASMIAAHDADADDTDAQRTLRVCYCTLHVSIISPRPILQPLHPLAWHRAPGDYPRKSRRTRFDSMRYKRTIRAAAACGWIPIPPRARPEPQAANQPQLHRPETISQP